MFATNLSKNSSAPGPFILHFPNAVISNKPTFSFTFLHSFSTFLNHLDLLNDQSSSCFSPVSEKKLANFFSETGEKQEDDWSFRRSKWFKNVEKECKNVKENVGLLDMTAFGKCRIKGPGAEEFLDKLVANKLPKKIGRINLCHALNTKGGVHSEFTIMRESPSSFYLVSAGAPAETR